MRQGVSKTGIVLKVLFGACVFAWMAWSGKLNLGQVAHSLAQWRIVLAIAVLGYAQVAITTWRWRLLLAAQEIRLSFRVAWGLVMIGMLFNVVVPGAVGGDLVKGFYITRAAPGKKSNAAVSVVMDRVVGLIGLLFLGAFMVAAHLDQAMASPATRSLALLTAGGFLGGIAGLYAALFAGGRLSQWRFLPAFLRDVFRALHAYHRERSAVPAALALSVVNQTFTCGMYYLALRAAGVADMPTGVFFLVTPLALVTTAIPISPGGIGVGQAAFFALFRIVAPRYASAGTDAVTVMQAVLILICLTGMYWYVSYKHVALDTAEPEPAHS